MATLTSNGSFSSLSISGSGTKNGNITFTPPTLPDGATIISTSLTANLDISMRLGSANVTINGNTYSSSRSLSIDLGTSLISSLSVSAKGSSFLARGTVSITNIVYTVNYVVKHTITASASEGGTISESGEIEIENGNSKTFTFTPNTGYTIDDVVVDEVSVGAVTSYTFNNVTSNHTISVSFAIMTYTISASVGNGGSISPSGNVSVNYGSSKTFSISTNSGYKIDDVLVDGVSVGAVSSYTFNNITENHTISATFRQVFTISANCGENGSISESGSIEVEPNSSKTFTFTPNDGYMINTVIVDVTDIGRVNSYTFENITSNHTLSVSFIIASYSLYVIDNTNKDGIEAYPTEKQINYDENVDIIVTTPQNTNISAKENGNDITLNKFNNEVFTFDNQTITDGFGKGIMYHIGNPTIYTDDSGNKMLYMDGNSTLKIDISYYANSDLTISFDFMLTNLNDTDKLYIFQIPYVSSNDFVHEHFKIYSEGYKLMYYFAPNIMDAYITLENNTWYNVALCRKDDTNYFFVNGNLIYSFSFTKKYEMLNIFSEMYLTSGTDEYITKCCIGYLKNIVVCDSCLHTQNYQVSDELLIESDFTGEYSVYNCTDETTLNVPYINNNLLKFEVLGIIKHINGKFYSNDRSLYVDFKGIKLTPNISTVTFTISFWYEPTLISNTTYTDECTLIYAKGKDINSNTCSIGMSHNSYSIELVKYENNSTYTKQINRTFEIDNKYYISFESDGLNYYLYINGELVSSYELSNRMSLDYIIIGSNNKNTMYNKGYIGNISFVNDMMSKGQDFSIYPINYPIENIYGYTATLSSPSDIIIELLRKIPILSINNITRNKISTISGYDTSVAKFTSDTDLIEWEARATVEGQPYGHGIGTVVDSGGELLANETATVTIDDEELTNGDVEYRISVYGKDANGEWSDG